MFAKSICTIAAASAIFACSADGTQGSSNAPSIPVTPPVTISGSAGSASVSPNPPQTGVSAAGSSAVIGQGQPGIQPAGPGAPGGSAGAPAAPGVTPPPLMPSTPAGP